MKKVIYPRGLIINEALPWVCGFMGIYLRGTREIMPN